jgi:hypothetical protein
VATEIVKRELGQRADAIAHFIKIAEACRELKDYMATFAILAGLNLSSVSRLKQSWAVCIYYSLHVINVSVSAASAETDSAQIREALRII